MMPIKLAKLIPDNQLTQREIEVIRLAAEGRNNTEIARALNLSPETIRLHIKVIRKKLNARNRTHAVAMAIQFNLLDMQNYPNG